MKHQHDLDGNAHWDEMQRDLVSLVTLLYEILLSAGADKGYGETFVRLVNDKLMATPDGWRALKLLRELDEAWACALQTAGVVLNGPTCKIGNGGGVHDAKNLPRR
jgi:hypothetical protein